MSERRHLTHGAYEELQLAIASRRPVEISYRDDAGHERVERVMPTAVQSAGRKEFLIYQVIEGTRSLPLDRIIRIETVT